MASEDVIINATKTTAMVVNFDVRDLIVVLFEGLMELKHPDHQTTLEACATIKETDPVLYATLHRTGHKVMDYIRDQMQAATPERMQ